MSSAFNGYHVWLGIPPSEQPPNHYRLLGIAAFEADLDVIDHAADRQMAHVRTFQSGQHGALSQQILNELSVARLCLLSAQKKLAYDDELRTKLSASQSVAGVPLGKALPVARPVTAVAAGGAIPTAVPTAIPTAVPTGRPNAAPTARPAANSHPTAAPARPNGPAMVATTRPAASATTARSAPAAQPVVPEIELDFDQMSDNSAPSFMLRTRRRYRRGSSLQRDLRLVSVAALLLFTLIGLYAFWRFAASGGLGEAFKSLEQNLSPPTAPIEAAPPVTDSHRPAPQAEPPAASDSAP